MTNKNGVSHARNIGLTIPEDRLINPNVFERKLSENVSRYGIIIHNILIKMFRRTLNEPAFREEDTHNGNLVEGFPRPIRKCMEEA